MDFNCSPVAVQMPKINGKQSLLSPGLLSKVCKRCIKKWIAIVKEKSTANDTTNKIWLSVHRTMWIFLMTKFTFWNRKKNQSISTEILNFLLSQCRSSFTNRLFIADEDLIGSSLECIALSCFQTPNLNSDISLILLHEWIYTQNT